jgi:hypothetical protein
LSLLCDSLRWAAGATSIPPPLPIGHPRSILSACPANTPKRSSFATGQLAQGMAERRLSRCHPVWFTLDPSRTHSFICATSFHRIILGLRRYLPNLPPSPESGWRPSISVTLCRRHSCHFAMCNDDSPSAPTQSPSPFRDLPLSNPGRTFLPSRWLPILAQRLTLNPKP